MQIGCTVLPIVQGSIPYICLCEKAPCIISELFKECHEGTQVCIAPADQLCNLVIKRRGKMPPWSFVSPSCVNGVWNI